MRRREQADAPVYYQFEQWADQTAIKHGVFTRLGGVSPAPWASLNVGGTVGDAPEAVHANLQRIYDTLDVDGQQVCSVWQIHSADAVIVDQHTPGRRWYARADGMVTNQRGAVLTMRFADCVPILLYDPVQQVIGIAHAGWRGTVNHMAGVTARTMCMAYDCHPADIQAAIGPSIGPQDYQVGPEVVEATQQGFGTTENLIATRDDHTTYLDLWEANRLSLQRVGVQHIEIAEISTAQATHEFFSHRAEKGKTGRFCAVLSLA